jgi:glutaredoxin
MIEEPTPRIIVYGTRWCYDTRVSLAFLSKNHIRYQWIDIDKDPDGRKYVEEVNKGYRSVPTIVFPDGDILVEPTNEQLAKKLNLPV